MEERDAFDQAVDVIDDVIHLADESVDVLAVERVMKVSPAFQSRVGQVVGLVFGFADHSVGPSIRGIPWPNGSVVWRTRPGGRTVFSNKSKKQCLWKKIEHEPRSPHKCSIRKVPVKARL